jgi:hypothetical protein
MEALMRQEAYRPRAGDVLTAAMVGGGGGEELLETYYDDAGNELVAVPIDAQQMIEQRVDGDEEVIITVHHGRRTPARARTTKCVCADLHQQHDGREHTPPSTIVSHHTSTLGGIAATSGISDEQLAAMPIDARLCEDEMRERKIGELVMSTIHFALSIKYR